MYKYYLAKNVPDHIFSAWRTGERTNVSVILAGIFSYELIVQDPNRNTGFFIASTNLLC